MRRERKAPAGRCFGLHTDPVRNEDCRGVLLFDYPSDQHQLLAHYILSEYYPDVDLNAPVCPLCLKEIERQVQKSQIFYRNQAPFYVDPTLSRHPILSTPERMRAVGGFTGRGVTIAFIDSGYAAHPDLLGPDGRIAVTYDAFTGRRRNLPPKQEEPPVQAWHGTMTAAVAAGDGTLSNGFYKGIAPEARLVLVSAVTPELRVTTPYVVRALRWIRKHHRTFNIRIINLSIGVDEAADSMQHPVIELVEELSRLGILTVAAAGNNPLTPVKPPGAAPSAITVGGYDDRNSLLRQERRLWHFSHGEAPDGTPKPDLLAPSIWLAAPILPDTPVGIEAHALFRMAVLPDDDLMKALPSLAPDTAVAERLSVVRSPLYARSIVLERMREEKLITPNYKHVDGTSFAAAVVSSVAAQLLEIAPFLMPEQIREILLTTAEPLPHIPKEEQGHGAVRPDRAVSEALRGVQSGRSPAPHRGAS